MLKGSQGNGGYNLDVFAYSSMINSLCNNGGLDEAFQIYEQMVEFGYQPNFHIYNMLTNGYCRKSMVVNAISIFMIWPEMVSLIVLSHTTFL